MVKKIIIGALVVLLVGALAVGVVDLLRGRASADGGHYGRGQGGRECSDEISQLNTGPLGRSGQGRGQGQVGETSQRDAQSQASVEEWQTVEGTVVSLDDGELVVATADGQEITVKLGPSWYWAEQDFPLAAGDQVTLTGFYDGDDFEVGQIVNKASGQTLTLREADGRPRWAGRGRRGQR
jgi:hypothetical protein